MVTEFDVELGDGRRLHAYDTGTAGTAGRTGSAGSAGTAGTGERLAVVWHHGTPNVGAPPEPLFAAADRLGLRWVSFDRPGYGGSTPDRGRDVAAAASWTAAVADALGIERFGVVGHSGGGPHALACGALLAERVVGVVDLAGLAPFDAVGLDWFAGMAASGVASLRAAAEGRAAKERFEAAGAVYDPEFTPDDLALLAGEWSWLDEVVTRAMASSPVGLIDDDLAFVAPWGFAAADVRPPVLVLHGGRDRLVPSAHGEWLAGRCPAAELRRSPGDGHISILRSAGAALEWLRARAG